MATSAEQTAADLERRVRLIEQRSEFIYGTDVMRRDYPYTDEPDDLTWMVELGVSFAGEPFKGNGGSCVMRNSVVFLNAAFADTNGFSRSTQALLPEALRPSSTVSFPIVTRVEFFHFYYLFQPLKPNRVEEVRMGDVTITPEGKGFCVLLPLADRYNHYEYDNETAYVDSAVADYARVRGTWPYSQAIL